MPWTSQGLTEQRTDFYADLTAVEITNASDTTIISVPKASFTNVNDGSTGAVTFKVSLTGAQVGVGVQVKGYKFMKGATVMGTGNFDVANTAVTTLDTFTLTFTVNNS
jgi:hypothetical protein